MNAQMSKTAIPRVAYFNERRLLVVDESIQPSDPEFMFVYSVHGHSLCLRKKTEDNPKISFDVPAETLEFAVEQYRKWQSGNPDVATALSGGTYQVSPLPMMRRECPTCEGQGVWMDRVNKCSYGVTQEETNIVERCETCHGACYVEDFL